MRCWNFINNKGKGRCMIFATFLDSFFHGPWSPCDLFLFFIYSVTTVSFPKRNCSEPSPWPAQSRLLWIDSWFILVSAASHCLSYWVELVEVWVMHMTWWWQVNLAAKWYKKIGLKIIWHQDISIITKEGFFFFFWISRVRINAEQSCLKKENLWFTSL